MANKIICLTGPSGSGKTSVAQKVQNFIPGLIILNGDSMRKSISIDEGFSALDRMKHNLRVARLAKELVQQTNIICDLIFPSRHARGMVEDIIHPKWVYIQRDSLPEKEGHFYEVPENIMTIDHDIVAIEDSAKQIVELFDKRKTKITTLKGDGITVNFNYYAGK